ncbi:MAG: hypothetical protein WC647_06405 [Desulfomonilaceae bacterium]
MSQSFVCGGIKRVSDKVRYSAWEANFGAVGIGITLVCRIAFSS